MKLLESERRYWIKSMMQCFWFSFRFSNFRQDKVTVQVWLCVSDPPRHVIKSQSETVWSYLTRLPWDSHISRITAQSVSLPSLIGHRDLLQRRGSFSFHIRPVLNGIDGSGSGQAQQRRGGGCGGWGGDGLELRPLRGAVAEKVSGNVLTHFCWGCLHQFRSRVPKLFQPTYWVKCSIAYSCK